MDQDRRTAAPFLKRARGWVGLLSSILRTLARPAFWIPRHTSASRVAGNFLMGDWFGDVKCRHGHPVRLFNIGRGHFVACDECCTYVFVGSNLMSSWRREAEELWRRNSESVEGYEFIEWGSLV